MDVRRSVRPSVRLSLPPPCYMIASTQHECYVLPEEDLLLLATFAFSLRSLKRRRRRIIQPQVVFRGTRQKSCSYSLSCAHAKGSSSFSYCWIRQPILLSPRALSSLFDRNAFFAPNIRKRERVLISFLSPWCFHFDSAISLHLWLSFHRHAFGIGAITGGGTMHDACTRKPTGFKTSAMRFIHSFRCSRGI